MSELHEHPAVELVAMLRAGECSRAEVTAHVLERIERANPVLRAFVTVDGDRAMDRARVMDENPHAINDTVLAGLPIGDKDLTNRAGVCTSFGSRAMADFVAPDSDPLVVTLDRNGANSVGKTNAPEFGFPSYTENRLDGGPARNPWPLDDWDPDRPEASLTLDPGGSSGGAAVAVAARMLPVAPGSDGGGSIRIPAAACRLVGLKPSRGLVPDASGFERAGQWVVGGPIARSVADAALLLDGLIARHDSGKPAYRYSQRPAASHEEPASFLEALRRGPASEALRIAVNTWTPWSEVFDCPCDPQALAVLDKTTRLAESLGHRVEPFTPAVNAGYSDAFQTVMRAGAAALPLPEEQLQALEPYTAWLVRQGREVAPGGLVTALGYLAAFERSIIEQYAPFDLVLTPSLAMAPRPLGWYDDEDGARNFMQQCQFTPYTSYVNVAGLPAITMPVGSGELPFGVQAIGRPGGELTLLRFAQQLEAEIGWEARVAPGTVLADT